MSRAELFRTYMEAVFDTDKAAAFAVVRAALEEGMTPEQIVFELVVPATEDTMSAITKDPDANLAQHFMTAQIASEVTEWMLERFSQPPEILGRVVIGTSSGDLHSLGKRIVSGCLKSLMVDVIDLGVNVSAEQFVEAALKHDAQVIAISSMMVHTATGENGCQKVRKLLQSQGLEGQFRVIVGGAPFRFDEELYQKIGADAWAADGISAGKVITDLIRGVKP